MTSIGKPGFKKVWLFDFEFQALTGENPSPVCLVAKELYSGQVIRLWEGELRRLKDPPYSMSEDSLFVAYYASAEFGCHLALNWPLPENVLDLFVEFRNLTNGSPPPCGNGLLGAMSYFGLGAMEFVEKDAMRELAMRGGPYTSDERIALLDYCESDVIALEKLFPKMEAEIDFPRALLRGRYMKAAAKIEYTGVPIDTDSLVDLKAKWASIQESLIDEIDVDYGVYEGRTFKRDRFAKWLAKMNIPWPRLESGQLNLSEDTFRGMAQSYPVLGPLRELRVSLSRMRLSELAVGQDGRNRCLLSAFRAKTSRNQPSTSKFIYGPAVWLRGLIRPEPGRGLAYIDWSQQEFGIAAALSKDEQMMLAYQSGDPYLAFAKQAGAVPENATKANHKLEREQFKACVLAVQYGMGEDSLAIRIGRPTNEARHLLELHRRTYRVFWEWSEAALNCAMLRGKLWTVFGWTIHITDKVNPRSLQNFPMQANGAEMLRLACCMATEEGIRVCAPVHDALLIEAPLDRLDEAVAQTQEIMAQASEIVLDGFRLRSDVEIIRYPDRYMDERGKRMWDTVRGILDKLKTCPPVDTQPVH